MLRIKFKHPKQNRRFVIIIGVTLITKNAHKKWYLRFDLYVVDASMYSRSWPVAVYVCVFFATVAMNEFSHDRLMEKTAYN